MTRALVGPLSRAIFDSGPDTFHGESPGTRESRTVRARSKPSHMLGGGRHGSCTLAARGALCRHSQPRCRMLAMRWLETLKVLGLLVADFSTDSP
jgi:hypothetical protein